MTKKDYELIAKVFSNQLDKLNKLREYHKSIEENNLSRKYEHAIHEVRQTVLDLAFKLKQENPKFDSNKFYEACGLNS